MRKKYLTSTISVCIVQHNSRVIIKVCNGYKISCPREQLTVLGIPLQFTEPFT